MRITEEEKDFIMAYLGASKKQRLLVRLITDYEMLRMQVESVNTLIKELLEVKNENTQTH